MKPSGQPRNKGTVTCKYPETDCDVSTDLIALTLPSGDDLLLCEDHLDQWFEPFHEQQIDQDETEQPESTAD